MIKMNDNLRPITSGMTEHETGISTILLYSDNSGKEQSADKDTGVERSITLNNFQGVVPLPDLSSSDSDLELLSLSESNIPLLEEISSEYYGVFNNFSIVSLQESKGNILKIHQNFAGNWNAFFMGEKPETIELSGILLDSPEFPYYQEFMIAYDKYLSGKKCIQNNMRMILSIDGKLIDGYIVQVRTSTSSNVNSPKSIKKLNFSVLVKKTDWVRFNFNSNSEKEFNKLSNIDRYNFNFNRDQNFGKSPAERAREAGRETLNRGNQGSAPIGDRFSGARLGL